MKPINNKRPITNKNSRRNGLIRPVREEDLDMLLNWRNHPDIRKAMLNQKKISWDEHLHWFHHKIDQDYKHAYFFEYEHLEQEYRPTGFISFSLDTNKRIADWGFYLSPEFIHNNINLGSALGETAIDFGFKHLLLHKIYGQVIAYNKRSITFHKNMGFLEEGILREHFFDGKNHYDIHCFGLIKEQWKTKFIKKQ